MTSAAKNRLLLVAAALLFSTGGAAIKAATLTGWQIASFRSGAAVLALSLFVPESRRNWRWHHLPTAASYAATLLLFVLATRLTMAANAIFLQSTAPLYLLLLGPLVLRERIGPVDVLFTFVVLVGMLLFFVQAEHAAATAPDPQRGNLLAACAGFTWALTITGFRSLGRHGGSENPAITIVGMGSLIAFLAALPMALPAEQMSWRDALVIGYLGVFQIGLAYVCMTRALRKVPALEAATLLLLEPALNPIWAWLIQGEQPGAFALLGGGIILSAALGNTWRQSRSRQLFAR